MYYILTVTKLQYFSYLGGGMINIKRAMKSNRIMKALTGLKIKEFKMLAVSFLICLIQSYSENRNVDINKGRRPILKSAEEKLFYILFYFKCYPTFDVAGFIFNVDRSNACRWVQWFLPALEAVLKKELVLPKRQLKDVDEFFRLFHDITEIFIDGTERPVQRPKDYEKQRQYYSGKKKRHTIKNIVVNDQNKRIILLTNTEEGKTHDKKAVEESEIIDSFPSDIPIYVDNGFQGLSTVFPNHIIIMPKRKPKKKELTIEEKENNKEISRRRILSENSICGAKRYRIVYDVFRNHIDKFDDSIMLAACGLWNYHLKVS